MLKKFSILFCAALAFGACANNTQTTNVNTVPANKNTAVINATPTATPSPAATNSSTNSANSNSLSVGDVTRISFAKGATTGTASADLPAGASKQYAVEATYGQKIKVTTDSKDATVKMLSGTDRQVESVGGGIILQVQTAGDVIFEVKNTSAQELKTNIRVEITNSK